jgi:hypothetical protein
MLVVPVLNELSEAASMYRAMSHGRRLVNGYSGHIPPWYLTLKEALDERDPRALAALAAAGVETIAVVLRNDRDGSWRNYVATGARPISESAEDGMALFALTRPAPLVEPVTPVGLTKVRGTHRDDLTPFLHDGRIDTWWSTFDPQGGGEELVLDLGSSQNFAGLEMSVGSNSFLFPRRLEIAVSRDDTRWSSVWTGPTAGLALGASLADAARTRVYFDLGRQYARFVRMRQTSRHRQASWTIAELRVLR